MRFERFIGIDPSLRTGFVALSPYGEVIEMKEIERDGDDPARMSGLIQAVVDAVHDTDFVAIEGFGYASQKGFLLGGIGWGIRIELYRRGIPYVDVAPSLLKNSLERKETHRKNGSLSKCTSVGDLSMIPTMSWTLSCWHKLQEFYMNELNYRSFNKKF